VDKISEIFDTCGLVKGNNDELRLHDDRSMPTKRVKLFFWSNSLFCSNCKTQAFFFYDNQEAHLDAHIWILYIFTSTWNVVLIFIHISVGNIFFHLCSFILA
jgi:hypothetical protein